MDMIGVGSVKCDNQPIVSVFCGSICVWPDPWTNIWDEGFPVTWENGWRDLWSLDPPPPTVEE